MIRYYKFPQRTEIWHKYRKGRWTGSTAINLLRDAKTPPESKSAYDNKYMLRGRMLEPLAIEAYERRHNTKVANYGFVTNSEYPHAGYSPDGIDHDGNLLEVKCLNTEKHNAIISGDLPIPTEYLAQIQFGLLITGIEKAKLILYNPDAEVVLHVTDILPNADIQANLKRKLDTLRPKRRPSVSRAQQKYIENNKVKIREARHKRYMESK